MARIRSLHPGQWNDDDFLECSPLARLLIFGLRNIADDRGVFEWKPTAIKRAILPVDNCDVSALLAELAVPKLDGRHIGLGRMIEPFIAQGRLFGAVRNFGRYQRAQRPSVLYPLASELKDYIGLEKKLRTIPGIEDAEGGCIHGIEALTRYAIPIQSSESPPHVFQNSPPDSMTRPTEGKGKGRDMREEGKVNSVPSERAPSATKDERVSTSKKAPPAPLDPDRDWLFSKALHFLSMKLDKPPSSFRSTLGKWLKELSDDPGKLRAIIEDAQTRDLAEPVGWITKAIEKRKAAQPNGEAPRSSEDDQWRWKVDAFKRTGVWSISAWGPRPDEPHTNIPTAILVEFGFVSAPDRPPPASSAG